MEGPSARRRRTRLARPIAGLAVGLAASLLLSACGLWARSGGGLAARDVARWQWHEVQADAPWAGRAGLHVVEQHGSFYLMGGRTPKVSTVPGDSTIWADVWRSDDRGVTWQEILATDTPGHWPARAYFQAVSLRGAMYVLGGQDYSTVPNPGCPPGSPPFCPPFVSTSRFFNDVWRSYDGVQWTQMTANAGWSGRAGLRATVFNGEIYVFGGSVNDDSSIIGPGGPARIYFNDVWKSRDGATWEQVTPNAPWAPRAGAVVVPKDGYLYLLGGESGFTCSPLPGCTPPYFNDVWRSRDGAAWELVTPAAGWSARPGHQCVVSVEQLICFGGFGLLENPSDVWVSRDGASWRQVSDAPWNATTPGDIKYDFEALAVSDWRHGPAIYTFGGDRETFDFTDPENPLRVDDDVWRFAPPRPSWGRSG